MDTVGNHHIGSPETGIYWTVGSGIWSDKLDMVLLKSKGFVAKYNINIHKRHCPSLRYHITLSTRIVNVDPFNQLSNNKHM